MAFILKRPACPIAFASLLPTGVLQQFNDRFRSATVQSFISGERHYGRRSRRFMNPILYEARYRCFALAGNIYSNLAAARLDEEIPVGFEVCNHPGSQPGVLKRAWSATPLCGRLLILAVQVAREGSLPAPLHR